MRTMLLDLRVSEELWGEAILHANWFWNRLSSKVLTMDVPYTRCYIQPPFVSELQAFGTKAFIFGYWLETVQKKWFFLREFYSDNVLAWKILPLSTGCLCPAYEKFNYIDGMILEYWGIVRPYDCSIGWCQAYRCGWKKWKVTTALKRVWSTIHFTDAFLITTAKTLYLSRPKEEMKAYKNCFEKHAAYSHELNWMTKNIAFWSTLVLGNTLTKRQAWNHYHSPGSSNRTTVWKNLVFYVNQSVACVSITKKHSRSTNQNNSTYHRETLDKKNDHNWGGRANVKSRYWLSWCEQCLLIGRCG